MTEQEFIEALAEKEHESWARWMTRFLDNLEMNGEGRMVMAPYYEEALRRQIDLPYAELSDEEKQDERDVVAHILPIIEQHTGPHRKTWQERMDLVMENLAALRRANDALQEENVALRTASERMGYGETGWPRVMAMQNQMAALRAENAALREMLSAIVSDDASLETDIGGCAFCGSVMWPKPAKHAPDCRITKARTLLGE